ncbi:MAG: chemotaxis protein CheW, partial [Lachnospiraceae bacterium]|nr:chemotaxis protein CheW [Lachnospiraceae bacterium]
QEPMAYTDRTCIIIINVKELIVGLIVEKVAEVVEIKEEDILPPPSATIGHEDKTQNRYVYGIGKVRNEVKLLLDPDRLLKDEELLMLEQATTENEEEGE